MSCYLNDIGHAPAPGEPWKSPDMAITLRSIASSGAKSIYQGELADAIDAFSRKTGGYIRKTDLENYWCEWVDPIHTGYRGYDVWEMPPNGNGIIALMALNLLKGFEFKEVTNLDDVLPELDILYMTRVQKERFFNEEDYIRMKDCYILTKEKMDLAKDDMLVLHPLPRVNEISVEVDNDPRAAYFKQVQFGVYVRMALILTLLGLAPEKI